MIAQSLTAPLVSVIIPCRNEAHFIHACLTSVLENRLTAGDFEVIVADGASVDRTWEIVAGMMAAHPNLRLIDNPSGAIPRGLNRMIGQARGRYIVRFDAHSSMPPGYLQRCVDALKKTGAANVGGICITTPRGTTEMAAAIAYVTSHWFGVGGSPFRCRRAPGPADTVVFGAFRRELFDEAGLFDERLLRNQDNEFNSRLRKAGKLVWLDPAIQVTYYNQATLAGLIRQAFGTGAWNVFTWNIAPHAVRFRHFAPGAFVAGLLLTSLVALTGGILRDARWVAAAALLVAPYWLALIAVTLNACRCGVARALLAAIVFPAYHVAYGSGILYGLQLAARGRWSELPGAPNAIRKEMAAEASAS